MLTVLALGLLAVAGFGDGPDDSEVQYVARHMPQPGSYSHVALPNEAPPAGALVSVASLADPERFGQAVSFMYDTVTVQACSYAPRRAAPSACEPQDSMRTFRRARTGAFVTVFTVSHKADVLPAAARDIEAHFARAPLTARPPWLADYARAALEKAMNLT